MICSHLFIFIHIYCTWCDMSSVYVCQQFKEKPDTGRSKENLLVIQGSVCYILKHSEDSEA